MTAQVRSAYSHTLNSCGWCSWWLSAKKPVGFYWTKLRSTTCSHARWSDLCMTIWLPWGKSFHYLQHLRFSLWCFWNGHGEDHESLFLLPFSTGQDCEAEEIRTCCQADKIERVANFCRHYKVEVVVGSFLLLYFFVTSCARFLTDSL